jgi:hypothetical protein
VTVARNDEVASLPGAASPPPRASTRWVSVISGVAVALLAWPVASLYPHAGFDSLWQPGLHLATHAGMQYGKAVVFTYGPYGFLSAPMFVFPWTGVLSLLYTTAVVVGFSTTVVHLGRRSMTLIGSVVIAYLGLLFMYFDSSEVAIFVLFLWCLTWVTDPANSSPVWFPYAGGALAALQLLIKFDTGIVALVIVAITLWVRAERRIREELSMLVSFFAALFVLWTVAGQHLIDIPTFVRRSLQVASGYSSAMGAEEAHRAGEYLIIAFALAIVLPMIIIGARLDRKRKWLVGALVVVAVYAEALHAFIRHDLYHSTPFLIFVAVIPVAVRWSRRFRAVAAACCLLPIVIIAILPAGEALANDWKHRPPNAIRELRLLVDSSYRRSIATQARDSARDALLVDREALGIMDGHTVALDSLELSTVWAYGLRWRPVPVFVTYGAYTDALDELNANALSSASGPQFVLRQGPLQAIDGRYPLFDSPAYQLAMICNFTAQHFTAHWELLARVQDRCGTPHFLSGVSAAPGLQVNVPRAGSGEIVYARFFVHQSLMERLRAKTFKPAGSPLIIISGRSYRFITGTADEPQVLCIPSGAVPPEYGGGVCPSTITLYGAGVVEIRFYAMRLR